MKLPDLNVKTNFNKAVETMQKGYTNTVKPAILKGVKYTKNLGIDTVDFVKTNPKKAGLAFAGAGLLVSTAAIISKMFKSNNELKQVAAIQHEHIGHQSEIIGALKEDIEERQVVMDALHDAIDVAQHHIQRISKQKEA